jgi:signal transduction histidine kinase/CheY-like chemotaxis protein
MSNPSADETKLRLLRQLSITCALTLLALGSLDVFSGFSVFGATELVGMCLMCVSLWWIDRGWFFASAQLCMVVTELVLFLFDDGFSGKGHSWILHMPLLAALYGLFDDRQRRWRVVWIGTSSLSLAVVNLTDWSPRWNSITTVDGVGRIAPLNFALAAACLIMVLTFLERRFAKQVQTLDRLSSDLKTALDKAEQVSETKTRLLSHVSHEFRTPLNAISGFAQLIQTERLSPSEFSENLDSIQRSADHLVHLVNNMLDLARIEHGELELSRTPFDPVDKIDDVVALLQPIAREKGLQLSARIEGEIETVEGDPVRLSQILLNLAGNAVKFTETGSVVLSLEQRPHPDDGFCLLRVEVSDTGPGIPESKHQFVFERFSRLEEHGPLGTGLGLAICRDLVERMSGSLTLRSRVGAGTTFVLAIPLRLAPLAPSGPSSDSWTRRPLAGKRILLCDDNRLNLRLASQVLKRIGADFDLAESGQETLDLLAKTSFDLLLLDLHMPGIDGFEVAQRVRRENGINRLVPILALTADSSESTRHRCMDLGMSGFAVKPIHLRQLELQIRRLLQAPS